MPDKIEMVYCNFIFPENNEVNSSRNVEFTERAANDAAPAEIVELGTYHDVAPVQQGSVNSEQMQLPFKNCNMETFDLDNSLNREFNIATYTWMTSYAADYSLGVANFPNALFVQTYIADKIANFRFFRAGLRISVRVVANKFLYGRIMVAYIPGYGKTYDFTTTPLTARWLSGFPHMIVSASAGETAIFDIPFICPNRAIDISTVGRADMGKVYFVVLNPLIDVSGDNSAAQVFVTAKFTDAELFMPHDVSTTSVTRFRKGKISQEVENSWGVVDSDFEPHSAKKKGAESRAKSEHNSVSRVYNSSAPLAADIESSPFYSSYVSHIVKFTRPVMELMAMAGLSKPSSLAATNINKINPFTDLNTGSGIDTCPTVGMDPENQISTKPVVAGITVDEMDFKQICGTPVLTTVSGVTSTSTSPFILAPCPFLNGNAAQFPDGNYADWLSTFFKFVSGSRKVKIYVTASQFHSVRLVLYLTDEIATADWMNCYHRILDIQGDTETEFTLPYASSKVVELNYTTGYFNLVALVLSWSQPDATLATPIYLNVYTSAADDIQYGAMIETFFTESNPRNDFSRAFEPFHESIRSYTTENFVFGEKYTTIREMIHKYLPVSNIALSMYGGTGEYPVFAGTGNVGAGNYAAVELLGRIFMYWRGTMRYKVLPYDNIRMPVYLIDTSLNVVTGTSMGCTTNPVVEFAVPYYDNVLFQSTDQNGDWTWCVYPGTNAFVFEAAGDDFSFHFIRPPFYTGGFQVGYDGSGVPVRYKNASNNVCGYYGLAQAGFSAWS